MITRCPETTLVEVEGEDFTLQCDVWSESEDGVHEDVHHVRLPPALGGDRTWTVPELP